VYLRSASNLEGQLERAALLDEAREFMPVDQTRNRVRDHGREPQFRELFDPPGIHASLLALPRALDLYQVFHEESVAIR